MLTLQGSEQIGTLKKTAKIPTSVRQPPDIKRIPVIAPDWTFERLAGASGIFPVTQDSGAAADTEIRLLSIYPGKFDARAARCQLTTRE